jgi:uncharacterized protein
MTLLETINNDLKSAMRAKETLKLSVLRMLITAVKNKKIELKLSDEMNDEQILAIVKSEVKKRKDSIQAYTDGGRQDLADIEESEIKVLAGYMPEQMSDEDLESKVRAVIDSIDGASMQDFGKIMGQAMGAVKGLADGDRVSATVKKLLAK